LTAFATNTPPGGPHASSPTWNDATAAGPALRTGSGAQDAGNTRPGFAAKLFIAA
jgi:hypothetical protein